MRNTIPIDNIAYSTLLSFDKGKSLGSGIRIKYKFGNYLVTANHVLKSRDDKKFENLILTCPNANNNDEPLILNIDLKTAIIYSDDKNDIATIHRDPRS